MKIPKLFNRKEVGKYMCITLGIMLLILFFLFLLYAFLQAPRWFQTHFIACSVGAVITCVFSACEGS